jgi:predicted dehydrogenase
MKKLRAGVIGVGYLGQFHAEKYAAIEQVDLVGILDTDRARADMIAQKLNTRAFSDPGELIGNVDMVSIVVPTIHHHRVARSFLEKGIHVLLEKPITVTHEEADELIAIAEAGGLVLQIGHIERFSPALTALKPFLKAPHYITSERSAPFTVRCTDVNVVLDLMIHDLDIVSDIAGSAPVRLSATGSSIITREIDIASARIEFAGGCVADVVASRISEEKKRILRVFDGDRMYTADYQAQNASCSQRRRGTEILELAVEDISRERCDTLLQEIKSFIKCIEQKTKPLVSGSEGKRALTLAHLITRSIEQRISGFVPVG